MTWTILSWKIIAILVMINNHSVVAKNHPPSVPSSISVLHISIKVKILSFGPFLRSRWLRISPPFAYGRNII